MRGKSEYPTQHGDQHSQVGSDPLVYDFSGFIRYLVENSGEWLQIAITGSNPSVDGNPEGLRVIADRGIYLHVPGSGTGSQNWIETSAGTPAQSLTILQPSAHTIQTQSIINKLVSGLGSSFGTVFRIDSTNAHATELFELNDDGQTTLRFYDGTSFYRILKSDGTTVLFEVDDDGTILGDFDVDGGGP